MSKLSDHEGRDLCDNINAKLSRILEITKSANIRIVVQDIGNDLEEIEQFFKDRIAEQDADIADSYGANGEGL